MLIKAVHLEDSMSPSRTSPRCTVPSPDGWFSEDVLALDDVGDERQPEDHQKDLQR